METALAIVQLLVPPPRSIALFLWGSCSLPLETVRAFHRGGMETNCLQVGPGGEVFPPELVRSTHKPLL